MGAIQPILVLFDAEGRMTLACRHGIDLLQNGNTRRLLEAVSSVSGDGVEMVSVSLNGTAYRALRLNLSSAAEETPSTAVLLQPAEQPEPDTARIRAEFRLTEREEQVLSLAMQGLATKEIAGKLGISPSTAKVFLRLAASKMGAANRDEMMAKLLRHRP